MPEIVIAVYRPKAKRESDLLACVRSHVATLRNRNLATSREPIVARSRVDGSVIEVFEWKSADAAALAHDDPAVQEIWNRISECAEYSTLASLDESRNPFPHFDPVPLAAADSSGD